MKVIFLEDVPRVANTGEVKEVADGYGRNYLIPGKLAALVRPEVTDQIEARQRVKTKKQQQLVAELAETAKQLEGKELVITAKVGAKEHLYGSITSADIAAELEKTTGVTVDKRKIEMEGPIRELGSFDIAIRLGKDVLPKIKVTIKGKETKQDAG